MVLNFKVHSQWQQEKKLHQNFLCGIAKADFSAMIRSPIARFYNEEW